LEQGARAGAEAFHCERRERVLDRDIRRLGTATTISPNISKFGQHRQLVGARGHDAEAAET
jgi:hypothetical protein